MLFINHSQCYRSPSLSYNVCLFTVRTGCNNSIGTNATRIPNDYGV